MDHNNPAVPMERVVEEADEIIEEVVTNPPSQDIKLGDKLSFWTYPMGAAYACVMNLAR